MFAAKPYKKMKTTSFVINNIIKSRSKTTNQGNPSNINANTFTNDNINPSSRDHLRDNKFSYSYKVSDGAININKQSYLIDSKGQDLDNINGLLNKKLNSINNEGYSLGYFYILIKSKKLKEFGE